MSENTCRTAETKANEPLRTFKRLLLVLILVGSLLPATVYAQAVGDMRVLIGFIEAPNVDDEDRIRSLDGEIERSYDLISVIAATLPSGRLNELKDNPRVMYVEPDRPVHAMQVTVEVLPWGIDRIDAELVAADIKGAGVEVAILDTGIQLNHPDLLSNITGAVNCVLRACTSALPLAGNDDNGHGTHVAGSVAAVNNGMGVVGVAPAAKVYAVKVLDRLGNGWTSSILGGIERALSGPDGIRGTSDDAEVINMSLGSPDPSASLQRAVDAAFSSGALVVASAGNDSGGPVMYPAAYDSVIAVSAIIQGDILARFSSTGPEVGLSAPGANVFSTYINGRYATLSGTSMSAPHVSGTAALILSSGWYHLIPDLEKRPGIVRKQLLYTAEDIGLALDDAGMGLVDAEAAVQPPGMIEGAVTVLGGDIIDGVTVRLSTGSGITNHLGQYVIRYVPAGSYTVTASKPGYISASHPVIVGSGLTATVHFSLGTMPPPDIRIAALKAGNIFAGNYNISAKIENLEGNETEVTVMCSIYDATGTVLQQTLASRFVSVPENGKITVDWSEPALALSPGNNYVARVTVDEDPTAIETVQFSVE